MVQNIWGEITMRFKRQAETLLGSREVLGLTQAEVAKKLGITTQQYGQFELGKIGIPLKHAKKLEKVLDVKLKEAITNDILENLSRKIGY
jgi:transcriptional regulator with XRE-family HTH domain